MPTWNRADTLGRAIQSVRAQRCGDWELIVVDDGSTDETAEVLASVHEPRMRVIRQENQGVAGARNTALRAAGGDLIAFLDSDDEWPRHHLSLMAAFFDAHPGEDLATSEWWEDFGNQNYLKHFDVEMQRWYPRTGRRIGARLFLDPPPRGDPALRFYESVSPIGAWAADALAGTSARSVRHYRGNLFPAWRWGWLTALQPTVLTRRALEAVGPFDTTYRVACDFGFLAELCRRYTMNMFTVPGCYKHELGPDGRPIKEGHLVSGSTSVRFHQDVLRYLETLYLAESPGDPDLRKMQGFRRHLVGRAALLQGDRRVAREYLEQALGSYRGLDVRWMYWVARLGPTNGWASRLFGASEALRYKGLRALQLLGFLQPDCGASLE